MKKKHRLLTIIIILLGIHQSFSQNQKNDFGTSNFNSYLQTAKDEVSIFPIPANYFVYVKTESNLQSVKIYDEHHQLHITSRTALIDISNLTSGIYYAHIITDQLKLRKKIVKK